MKRINFPLCALVASLVGAGSLSATSIVTTPGLSITTGPLTFTNFTCSTGGTGSFHNACGATNVSAITPAPPNGIMFTGSLGSTGGNSSADMALTFTVADAAGINNVGLSFNTTFNGFQVNSVTEDVYSSVGGPLVGTATVSVDGKTNATTYTDNITLTGAPSYTNLYITKDINLSGYNGQAFGSTSIITQTFSGPVSTPEPVSMSLFGGGLALLGLVGLRKKKA